MFWSRPPNEIALLLLDTAILFAIALPRTCEPFGALPRCFLPQLELASAVGLAKWTTLVYPVMPPSCKPALRGVEVLHTVTRANRARENVKRSNHTTSSAQSSLQEDRVLP